VFTQEESQAYADKHEGKEWDREKGEEEEEEPPAPLSSAKKKAPAKKKSAGSTAGPRRKNASTVHMDLNQNFDTYWERMNRAFDERKHCDPQFNSPYGS
jgi:hypothetical protein